MNIMNTMNKFLLGVLKHSEREMGAKYKFKYFQNNEYQKEAVWQNKT